MAKIRRWWATSPAEIYWLEVTRRPDIGANLKAPQTNERGADFWSYSLVKEVQDGDIVFHYDGNTQAIVARSLATGIPWEGELTWAARGASARFANIAPHSRPGYYFGLESYNRLTSPLSLEAIRAKAAEIRRLRDALIREVHEPLFFPFEIGDGRPIRPMQGYLFKLPRDLVALLGLGGPISLASDLGISRDTIGDQYRLADELAVQSDRDPFSIDPALVERGVRGHATTQNGLARYLTSLTIEPRSSRPDEPNFDLAWQTDAGVFVAEVKSITATNEEKQLRLGLGQVLRYAHQLGGGPSVTPVLVVERCPRDSSWVSLCERLGVILLWPEMFIKLISPSQSVLSRQIAKRGPIAR
jgi:hypothetical protein